MVKRSTARSALGAMRCDLYRKTELGNWAWACAGQSPVPVTPGFLTNCRSMRAARHNFKNDLGQGAVERKSAVPVVFFLWKRLKLLPDTVLTTLTEYTRYSSNEPGTSAELQGNGGRTVTFLFAACLLADLATTRIHREPKPGGVRMMKLSSSRRGKKKQPWTCIPRVGVPAHLCASLASSCVSHLYACTPLHDSPRFRGMGYIGLRCPVLTTIMLGKIVLDARDFLEWFQISARTTISQLHFC